MRIVLKIFGEIIKRVWYLARTLILTVALAAGGFAFTYSETEPLSLDVEMKYFMGNIQINNYELGNYDLKVPVMYSDWGDFYVPVDTENGIPIRLHIEEYEKGYINTTFEGPSLGFKNPITCVITTYHDRYEYISLRDLTSKGYIVCTYYFDEIAGLYLSTESDTDAFMLDHEEDRAYRMGLATYMQNACYREDLSLETALEYEFCFRHASREYGVDEILLMAVAHVESSYWCGDHSSKGARGIMQIMASSARAQNVDPDDLWDPLVNIDFGAMYIRDRIGYYCGDLVKALAAYNMGMAKVNSGNYSAKYANLVFKRQSQIEEWLTK